MLRSLPLSVNVARSHTKKHVLLTNIEKGGGELAAPDGSHPPCYASVISEVTLKKYSHILYNKSKSGWAVVVTELGNCIFTTLPLLPERYAAHSRGKEFCDDLGVLDI